MIEENWQARLDLRISNRAGKSVLTGCKHQGPLRVQKTLYPEGEALCHIVMLHPPGGIAGGDRLVVHIEAEENTQALVTTPGAGKWYRSGGKGAGQSVSLFIGKNSSLEWLPQENIFFDGVDARLEVEVEMDETANFLGLETSCLGRIAAGEVFTKGRIALKSKILKAGKVLWYERGHLEGGSPWLAHPAGLAGQPVFATLVAVGPMVTMELRDSCRSAERQSELTCGTTLLPGGLLVARCLGGSAEAVRHWYLTLWQVLRPALIGRQAVLPRIWNT